MTCILPMQTVIIGDDCALPPPRGIAGRRGLAGTILVHKVHSWSHFFSFATNAYKCSNHTFSLKHMKGLCGLCIKVNFIPIL